MSSVLANTELYETPLPDSTQVAFTPAKDGLPIFHGKTYEEHLEAWVHVTETIQCRYWALGAIAASLVKRHGDGAVKQLSKDVQLSTRRIYELAQTYRAFQKCERSHRLSFHHHTIASNAADPAEAIHKSEDGRPEGGMWSTRELERYIETGLEPGETSGIDAHKLADAAIDVQVDEVEPDDNQAMMAHLKDAQAVINILKEQCPNPKFVADVYNSWSDDLADYLEQYALESVKEKVIEAWRKGKWLEPELAKLTGIPDDQIHSVMKAYEREHVFEKVRRTKTQMAKGTPPWVWHLVGEPLGSDYERIPRVESGYQPFVEYGDDKEEHF